MALASICVTENLAWKTDLVTAYHYTNDSGQAMTVMRYQIPLSPEKEAVFIAKYGIAPSERRGFYENLVRCVQREISVSSYLAGKEVPSILTYTNIEQDRDESGVVSIYLETEQVWPITEKLLTNSISATTLLDLVYRLAIMLRDLAKEGVDVVHRGLDPNEIYINADNRVRLAGFFYSYCPGLGDPPDYLPVRPVNLPFALLNGATGTQAHDIMTLAIIAWNLFSGNPYDAKLTSKRMVFPEYASEEIVDALLCGMSGDPANCNLFRRKLADCRKILNKNTEEQKYIPIRKQLLKEYVVEYVIQGTNDCPEK